MHRDNLYAYTPVPGTKPFRILLRVLFGLFALLGFVFLLIGCIWLQNERAFFASAESVQGEIVSFASHGDGDWHPIVRYTASDAVYETEINVYSSSMRTGDTMTVYYDAQAPQSAKVLFYFSAIFLSIGGLFFLIGISGAAVLFFRGRKTRLQKVGEAVPARVAAVRCAERVRVNGRTPYYVLCKTGAVPALAGKMLKSGYVYSPLPQSLVGTPVRVYVHPNHPKRYFVDTASLQVPVQSAERTAESG